jgi:hypothetical protein
MLDAKPGVEQWVRRLAAQAALDERTVDEALQLVEQVRFPEDEASWAACALLVAVQSPETAGHVLGAFLRCADVTPQPSPKGRGSCISDFFERAKMISPTAQRMEQLLVVIANVHRKFVELYQGDIFDEERAWICFLTALALLASRGGPLGELPDLVSAYHLMVAVIRRLQLKMLKQPDILEEDVERYLARLETTMIPWDDTSGMQDLYNSVFVGRLGFDGRILLQAHHLGQMLCEMHKFPAKDAAPTLVQRVRPERCVPRFSRVISETLSSLRAKRQRMESTPLSSSSSSSSSMAVKPSLHAEQVSPARGASAEDEQHSSTAPGPKSTAMIYNDAETPMPSTQCVYPDQKGSPDAVFDELAAAAALQNLARPREADSAGGKVAAALRTPQRAALTTQNPNRVPPPSPRRSPIRGGIASVRWVRAITALASRVCENLRETYGGLGVDPLGFANSATGYLLQSFTERFHPETAEQRIGEVMAVYWYALESILNAETQRMNGSTDFVPKLLALQPFHKALLLCAVETVCASYGIRDEIHFEHLLESLKLSPFDFIKIIGAYVLNVENLPPQAKRRLAACQECVLCVLAWQSDSLLVRALRTGDMSSIPTAALDLFFDKLLMQADYRILNVCARLGICEEAFENRVWSIFKLALTEQWELFIGRHLDTVLLCCFYGAAKTQRSLQFKFVDIIRAYRAVVADSECIRLSDSLQAVYRDLALDDGGRGDIIAFYNLIFVPHMKRYLLGQTTPEGPAAALSMSSTPERRRESESELDAHHVNAPHASPVSSPGLGPRIVDKIISSPLRLPRIRSQSGVVSLRASPATSPRNTFPVWTLPTYSPQSTLTPLASSRRAALLAARLPPNASPQFQAPRPEGSPSTRTQAAAAEAETEAEAAPASPHQPLAEQRITSPPGRRKLVFF